MPELGIRGAAWATGIGQTASLLFYLILNHVKPLNVEISLREMRPVEGDLRRYVFSRNRGNTQYGADIPASDGAQCDSGTIFAGYIFWCWVFTTSCRHCFIREPAGVVQGMRPLIGYNYGAGEQERVKKIFRAAS